MDGGDVLAEGLVAGGKFEATPPATAGAAAPPAAAAEGATPPATAGPAPGAFMNAPCPMALVALK